ncbi:alpha/beta fold hydrolase [Parasedimentitalea huanghaiensis]|uniref:Alpha/beta fold hydrolase n=1 Tax=Parasedimentitalea huanghaiensis TaxID=2682100 RepID=A0A6L6WIH6_9RHOB|nr:alpha/beta hydrolase [Zongyanglinia huanghaiensis]MVO17593.1 alpha/beta fold hydrolase [Zongyanglinia huanghaiensis]
MTPLLLLPGMMCDARLFQPQIDALSGRIPLITAPIGNHDTMQALAEEILNYAPPHFAMAGLSMGGILAMEVLRQAPDRVDRIGLLDTNPLAEIPEVQARRAPQIKAAKNGELRRIMRDEMKPNYLADGPNMGAILDLCMAMATDLGPDVFINQSCALRDRPDQCDTLRQFERPALVLCGREDKLCPVERHEMMHKLLPNSRLQIIDGAGHLPTLEQPEITTAALIRWLEDT